MIAKHWPDTVEDIDQNQEKSDKQSHPKNAKVPISSPPYLNCLPARHNLRLDQKTDPADDHKHEAW